MNEIQSDLQAMNVSWFSEDLELYDNQYGFLESIGFTVARLVTLIFGIIVHRATYKLMKRLPNRAVNQLIYPSMVRCLIRLPHRDHPYKTFAFFRGGRGKKLTKFADG